jgi:hypothetical protein
MPPGVQLRASAQSHWQETRFAYPVTSAYFLCVADIFGLQITFTQRVKYGALHLGMRRCRMEACAQTSVPSSLGCLCPTCSWLCTSLCLCFLNSFPSRKQLASTGLHRKSPRAAEIHSNSFLTSISLPTPHFTSLGPIQKARNLISVQIRRPKETLEKIVSQNDLLAMDRRTHTNSTTPVNFASNFSLSYVLSHS